KEEVDGRERQAGSGGGRAGKGIGRAPAPLPGVQRAAHPLARLLPLLPLLVQPVLRLRGERGARAGGRWRELVARFAVGPGRAAASRRAAGREQQIDQAAHLAVADAVSQLQQGAYVLEADAVGGAAGGGSGRSPSPGLALLEDLALVRRDVV